MYNQLRLYRPSFVGTAVGVPEVSAAAAAVAAVVGGLGVMVAVAVVGGSIRVGENSE
jgi:hypothetical protein